MFTCLESKNGLFDHWNYDMLCFDAFSILWEPKRDWTNGILREISRLELLNQFGYQPQLLKQ